MPAIISYNSHLGISQEATWGTAVTPPKVFIPFDTLKAEDDIKRIVDKAKRGNLSQDFASYAGVGSAKIEQDSMVYMESFGYLLKGIFGQDTVTGAAAPYTHTFQLANAQPPSFTLSDYDGVNERLYAGAVISELGLKFTTEGELTASAKFEAKKSTTAAQVSTPTYGTNSPFIGYQLGLQIAGAANTRLIGGDLTFKRGVKFTFGANNSQDPTKVNVGPMEVTGKLDFEIDDYTELNYYLNTTQPIVVLTFTSGTNILTVTMSKCDFEKIPGLDRSQEMVRVNASIRGLYNATDAGPCAVTLKNGVQTYN